VISVVLRFLEKEIWTDTLPLFMRERNHLNLPELFYLKINAQKSYTYVHKGKKRPESSQEISVDRKFQCNHCQSNLS
jgi:hypothetical protein